MLNFEGADLREVVRNILGDILNETYTIDPAVGGTVTIRTSSGIPREALPATLETLLRMNGATMVKSGGMYLVVPQAAAVRGNITPQLGSSTRALPRGILGADRAAALRRRARDAAHPRAVRASDAQAVRPDELRNMLILSGTERELRHLMDTIEMFDIDWMAGMSAGVFTLQNSDVKEVMKELEKIVGDRNTSPITGILKIVPIERMNALLVVTPQPAYLDEVKKWIERLDRGGDGGGPAVLRLPPAEHARRAAGAAAAAGVHRPRDAAAGSAVGAHARAGHARRADRQSADVPAAADRARRHARDSRRRRGQPAAPGAPGAPQGTGIVRNLQVVADKDANTLLVDRHAAEYTIIEQALQEARHPAAPGDHRGHDRRGAR